MSATHEVAEDLCVVHTSHPILSAENLVDFQRFMGELDRAGRESHFWQMWGAVWPSGKSVICRFQTKSSRIFPSVVARYLCRRCNQGVGGFQFPCLGPSCRALWL